MVYPLKYISEDSMLKKLSSMLMLAFTISAHAEVVKTDSGFVSWTVNVKDEVGMLTYSRMSVRVDSSRVSSEQEREQAFKLSFNSGLGVRHSIALKFDRADELSSESIIPMIAIQEKGEVSKYRFKVIEKEGTLNNVSCSESGFIKKKLKCTAEYQLVQVLELNKN
jgi:hypothetical protein